MDIDQAEVDRLVLQPAETRGVEIKSWIDPRTPEGKAKILAALIALRNFDGGYLLVGFDDDTLQPLPVTPTDVFDSYHNDIIQALVSKHASEPFDIAVGYGQRDGLRHPVIAVSSGVRTPVAVKSPVTASGGSHILKKGTILFRSLLANGVVSSSEAQPGDWPEIMQICMDNREADIGRFIRRHLGGINGRTIIDALSLLPQSNEYSPLTDRTSHWLEEGAARAEAAFSRWHSQPFVGDRPDIEELIRAGAWEVALIIDPPSSGWVADNAFYNTIAASVPQHSGWPIWLGTRHHADALNRHQQRDDGWEALVVSILRGHWDHLEFQRWEPKGRFYLRRLHDDDAAAKAQGLTLGRILDLGRAASRVAEAIISGLAIARSLRSAEDTSHLAFYFRWTGLEGRRRSFWASQLRYAPTDARCLDQSATSVVTVPQATAAAAVTPYVADATRSLFSKFDGFSMSNEVLETCVQLVVNGRT